MWGRDESVNHADNVAWANTLKSQTGCEERAKADSLSRAFGVFDLARTHIVNQQILSRNYETAVSFIEGTRKYNFPGMPAICFYFTDEPDINAYAFMNTSGDRFIATSAGGSLLLAAVFSYMLSHHAILKDIGNPAHETQILIPFNLLTSDMRSVTSPIPMPLDSERRDCSFWLQQFAIHFLVAHEFAHHIYGHLELDTGHGLNLVRSERGISQTDLPPEEAIVQQALEFSADTYAAALSLGGMNSLVKVAAKDSDPELMIFRSPRTFVRCWLFAVLTMSRLFCFDDRHYHVPAKDLAKYTYPPWTLRCLSIAGIAKGWCCHHYPNDFTPDSFDQLAQSVFMEVEGAVLLMNRELIDLPRQWLIWEEANSPEYREHANKVIREWESLIPHLKDYAFCEF